MSLKNLRVQRRGTISVPRSPNIARSDDSLNHYDFSVAVWGRDFASTFVDHVLPNQLTYGNLGAFSCGEITYRIYTTAADWKHIKNHWAVDQLQSTVLDTPVYFIDDLSYLNTYELLNECCKHAIRIGYATGSILVFPLADQIWADGSFRHMRTLIESGMRVVLTACPRLEKEKFLPAAKSRYTSRELVKSAIPCLHHLTRSLFMDSDVERHYNPTTLYWKVPDGFIARYFHCLPVMVKPCESSTLPAATIDDDLAVSVCPDFDLWHIIDDSDDAVGFELTSRERWRENYRTATDYDEYLVAHSRQVFKAHHRFMFGTSVCFHHGSLPELDASNSFYRQFISRVENEP